MKHELMDILACPDCHKSLTLETAEQREQRILTGTLTCEACRGEYPIREGVPRFVQTETPEKTGARFDVQWRYRRAGSFEKEGTLYHQDCDKLVAWWFSSCFSETKPGEWMLDAGCGTGEKAMAAARQNPRLQVVALDIGDTVAIAANGVDVPSNVHFIQGDVTRLPFPKRSFAKVVSWGVLHSTPDTEKGFRAVADYVDGAGDMLVWIYPHHTEDPFLAKLYKTRERHFLGLGHRIPPPLLLWLTRAYCLVMGPAFLRHYKKHIVPRFDEFKYFSFENLGLWEKYKGLVFLVYDTLLPKYQYHHRKEDVMGWYGDYGFSNIQTDGAGHFWGRLHADAKGAEGAEDEAAATEPGRS